MKFKSSKNVSLSQKTRVGKSKKDGKTEKKVVRESPVEKTDEVIEAGYNLLESRLDEKRVSVDDVLSDLIMKIHEGDLGDWRDPQQYRDNIKTYMKEKFQIDISQPEVEAIRKESFEYLIDFENNANENAREKLESKKDEYKLKLHPKYPEYTYWGFDSASFKNPENFRQVLELNELNNFEKLGAKGKSQYKWSNKDKTLEVITDSNPLSSLGKAGRITIQGKMDEVIRLVNTIDAFSWKIKREIPLENTFEKKLYTENIFYS